MMDQGLSHGTHQLLELISSIFPSYRLKQTHIHLANNWFLMIGTRQINSWKPAENVELFFSGDPKFLEQIKLVGADYLTF